VLNQKRPSRGAIGPTLRTRITISYGSRNEVRLVLATGLESDGAGPKAEADLVFSERPAPIEMSA